MRGGEAGARRALGASKPAVRRQLPGADESGACHVPERDPADPRSLCPQDGYPLVTLLVCLVEEGQYAKQMEVMSEFLVKQMKVKEYR
jgi:hypothetical protein